MRFDEALGAMLMGLIVPRIEKSHDDWPGTPTIRADFPGVCHRPWRGCSYHHANHRARLGTSRFLLSRRVVRGSPIRYLDRPAGRAGVFLGRWHWRLGAPWAGVLTGLGFFAAFALLPPTSARSALAGTADPPILTALLFAGLFLLFGLALELCWLCRKPIDLTS